MKTIAFAGDTVLARRLNAFVDEHGPTKSLAGVREVLAGADVSVVNLECIIASGGEPVDKGERNSYYYRGRPELVRVLTEAGVDVASLANNHAGDYGPDAVVEGVEILRKAGVSPLGAGRDVNEAMAPVFRKVGDTVVAFIGLDMTQRKIGATARRAGPHVVLEQNPGAVVNRVQEQVQLARRFAHLVFLVTHWGANYDEEPSDRHRTLARRLVREAGIDGLLGSSAHQIQGMEVVDGRPIIYDAGDLLFDFDSDDWTHKTAIFVLHFDRRGVRWVEAVPIRMSNGMAKLATGDDQREILARLDDLTRRLSTKLWIEDGRAMLGIWDVRRRPEPRESWTPPPERDPVIPTPTSYRPPNVIVDKVPESATAHRVRFDEGVELLGYEFPDTARHLHGVPITTYWRTTKRLTKSYQIFTHVEPRADDHRPRWRGDHQPGDWSYPTTRWRPGEIIRDRHFIRPPGNSERGIHDVYVGLFKGPRLKILDEEHNAGRERVKLGAIDVGR